MSNALPTGLRPNIDPGYLAGTDLSHWQAKVDWKKVEGGGIDYAWLKASDGASRDPTFLTRWTDVKKTSIFAGAYHFLRPRPSGAEQAKVFLKLMGPLGPNNLPPVVDVEWAARGKRVKDEWVGMKSAEISKILSDWIDAVEKGCGVRPIIYTHPYWWDPFMGRTSFGKYPLWLSFFKKAPKLPADWKTWTFWQWTDRGNVPGVGNIDRNRFKGSRAELKRFIAASVIKKTLSQ